jgi:hypothetical protein
MKTTKLLAVAGLGAPLLGGCATRASSVAPVSISANEYTGMSCQDSRQALEAARQKEYALTRKQNNAATYDAAGVALFAIPVGSLFGADVAGELAEAKGEVLALQRHTDMQCDAEAARGQTPMPAQAPASAAPAGAAQTGRQAANARAQCGDYVRPDGTMVLRPCR